jgi:predicted RNA-binding protein YlqC (UPF0109 family)
VSDDGNAVLVPTATEVLLYLVRQLVDEPDAVSVEAGRGGRRGALRLDVRVAPGDLGRVIGKRGRTAQAIRAVVRAAAVRDDVASLDVEFVD